MVPAFREFRVWGVPGKFEMMGQHGGARTDRGATEYRGTWERRGGKKGSQEGCLEQVSLGMSLEGGAPEILIFSSY